MDMKFGLSLSLSHTHTREEHTLKIFKIFENRMFRRIFGTKEVGRGGRLEKTT